MLRGELDFCLCNVCASARNRSPEQGDIAAGLKFFKELFADGAVENTAPPQLQGQTAAHSALGTQHDASGPSMFEVGLLNALLASDEAHLGGGYGAVVNAADHEANPIGLAGNASVHDSEFGLLGTVLVADEEAGKGEGFGRIFC